MQKYHFISGLPRAGSTLLTSLLNQNPKFYSNISNPLARFIKSIINESYADPGHAPETKRIELIKNLVSTYYSDRSEEVCFNTNCSWSALLSLLDKTHPDSKVICCVQDICWVLDSFEQLFKANPFVLSQMYGDKEAETVYTRAYSLMSPGRPVRFAYDSLKEAITCEHKHKIMLVEYEQLAKNPEQTMKAIYSFIKEPYFNHNFNSVETTYDEYDAAVIIPGLHTIRKEVKYIERNTILPPDIWNEFSNLEVWR